MAERSLHHHGVDPAAVLVADAGQAAHVGEAETAVQRDGGSGTSIGDDGDYLAYMGLRADGQQGAAEALVRPVGAR